MPGHICNIIKPHKVYSNLHAKFSISSSYNTRDLCVQTDRHGSIASSSDAAQEYSTFLTTTTYF